MLLSDFDFDLSPDSIATKPVRPRDSARLLILSANRQSDRRVLDLPDILRPDDLLIVNNTRVIPARLTGRKGKGKIEVTLHKEVNAAQWWAFARPGKKCQPGARLDFAPDFIAGVREKRGAEVLLDFNLSGAALKAALHRHGHMPLPPYIKRAPGEKANDAEDYQTLFAQEEGAVAAPTAGLHFTPRLMNNLARKGVRTAYITLHVGAGTFLPVQTDRIEDHSMHSEWCRIPDATVAAIAHTRNRGGRVVAVGTTSLRTLESMADGQGGVRRGAMETDIFIRPGFRFQVADLLLTNFHLPKSTLFMLVAAFSGLERMKDAYAHAQKTGYRFFSYGDACLLDRRPSDA